MQPDSNLLDIAVVGATGAVGEALLRILEERAFPAGEIRPLASERSTGSRVRIRGRDVAVRTATPESFDGIDLVFFAATGELSKQLAPEAVERGAIVIDKSNTWRMEPGVPLVVPEINPEALDGHRGIVASPNCTTVGIVMALEPIRRLAGLRSVVITTLQAASGAGKAGSDELLQQRAAIAGGDSPIGCVFPAPLEDNVVPVCERLLDNGYSSEEMKLLHETRKILGLPGLGISMTCVRVPVGVGHSATLLLETEQPVSAEQARSALSAFPGVEVIDDPATPRFPTPREAAGGDGVLVGRVRSDMDGERLWLWQVSDNLRKGAATNAVQIAEALIARGLVSGGTRAIA